MFLFLPLSFYIAQKYLSKSQIWFTKEMVLLEVMNFQTEN